MWRNRHLSFMYYSSRTNNPAEPHSYKRVRSQVSQDSSSRDTDGDEMQPVKFLNSEEPLPVMFHGLITPICRFMTPVTHLWGRLYGLLDPGLTLRDPGPTPENLMTAPENSEVKTEDLSLWTVSIGCRGFFYTGDMGMIMSHSKDPAFNQ